MKSQRVAGQKTASVSSSSNPAGSQVGMRHDPIDWLVWGMSDCLRC